MSRSFFHTYKHFMKFIDVDDKAAKLIPVQIQLGLIGTILGGHACYAYGTQSKNQICVNKTYMYTQNGCTEFMIIDQNGKHYNINNSFWYWKWNSIEDWHNINTGDVLNVKYYGFRIPLFGVFPNIVYSRDIRQEPSKKESTFMEINNIITL